jgi:His-Xaa-Ser system protein HxsD
MSNPGRSSWQLKSSEGELAIPVDLRVYTQAVLFRVCYLFTDRCYLFLEPDKTLSVVIVHLSSKSSTDDLAGIAGEFANELINQRVREDIARETRPIRELIVAQAFAEADLLDRTKSEGSYLDDPKGIAK